MIAVVIASLIYLFFWIYVLVASNHRFYFADSVDIYGVGQLIMDILLFPIIIIGFVIAIAEFRKSQSLPELRLYWMRDPILLFEEIFIE